jgi:hypothetical protein
MAVQVFHPQGSVQVQAMVSVGAPRNRKRRAEARRLE